MQCCAGFPAQMLIDWIEWRQLEKGRIRIMKMKMKRIVSLVLCSIMAVGVLAAGTACSKTTTTDTKATDAVVTDAVVTDAAKKVLRVGMECAYAPFNWTQND